MYFNLMIIGDEILHGNRADKHFAFFKSLLAQYGLQLGQVQYLPDERALLVKQLQRSFSDGLLPNHQQKNATIGHCQPFMPTHHDCSRYRTCTSRCL